MAKQQTGHDDDGGELVVETESLGVLDIQTRGEIDVQIATAKKYPRSIKKFKETALEMATLDEATAEQCIYAVPRDGKSIEGPSARLAEIVLSAWGNSRAGARTISDDGNFVTAQGAFHDLERNVAINFEVRRRIVNKHGKRYTDDMIATTANAACSIALRNAVFKGIPKAFWAPIYDAAKKTAIGDASTLANRRSAMLEYFQKLGAPPPRVFELLGVKGTDDITLDHMAMLKGLATAIKEGEVTVDEAFSKQTEGQQGAGPPTSRTELRSASASKEAEAPKESTEQQKSSPPATSPEQHGPPKGEACTIEWSTLKTRKYALGPDGQKIADETKAKCGYGELAFENMTGEQLRTVLDAMPKPAASTEKKGGKEKNGKDELFGK